MIFSVLQTKPPATKSTADQKVITNLGLKERAPILSASLSYLFNLSLLMTVLPDVWKKSGVVPTFSKRKHKEPFKLSSSILSASSWKTA